MPVSSVSVALSADAIDGNATFEIEVLMFATVAPRMRTVRISPALAGAEPSALACAGVGGDDTGTSSQFWRQISSRRDVGR